MKWNCLASAALMVAAGCGDADVAPSAGDAKPAAADVATTAGEESSAEVAGAADGAQPDADTGPTILGFSPEVRAEMRKLMAAEDPAANADKKVQDYMDRVRKQAELEKIEPNATGDYEYPTNEDQQWRKVLLPKDAVAVAADFDLQLPDWAEPLVDEQRRGTISPVRGRVLVSVILFELSSQLSE